jgi:hypothetical protein
MLSESEPDKDTEILYWMTRATEAERMLELEREYISDLYEMRDAGI